MSFHYESRVYYSDTDCEGIATTPGIWTGRNTPYRMDAFLFGSPSQVVERYHMLFVVQDDHHRVPPSAEVG
jgi:hypothetical protein